MTTGAARREDTDAVLLDAAALGDRAAFDELVRRHTPRMHRVALRVVGDAVEAEDVVQDAWVAVWRGLGRFRGDAAASTWLHRVVTNAALAHVRRRRLTVPLDTVLDAAAADAGDGPERSAVRNETSQIVLRAVATLEPSQRAPLVLRELEGMSYEEVAAVLGVPVPALHSRLHRARASLLSTLRELR
ncbi:RNA polymerase sigma factor [Umezawaea beigongshangensis]|uniref:RNA polymerase sigma factor n=1 Tax=Umezawaea beigongshangensis TaxID=2780383 RepID=UPI0027DE0C8D|nr:sigma-70 family RNA polymerase sigma factor [Umezawaea beigongshangensis]